MVWMTVGLIKHSAQIKAREIEILSQQLRIAYAIIFQPPCRPLDLILYKTGGAIEEYDAIHLYYKQRATYSHATNASVLLRIIRKVSLLWNLLI